MANTSEWLHFHHNTNNHNHPLATAQVASPYTANSATDLFFSGRVSEATVVSTTMNPTTNSLQSGQDQAQAQLGRDGRVSKPVRRRTRASRRTPTTMLNTDKSNFRAMVQQFTGGTSNKFSQMANLGQPQHGGFSIEPGLGNSMHFPVGPLQYSTNTTAAMSSSTTTNDVNTNPHHASYTTNPNMFMQCFGEGTLFTTGNNNLNVGLLGGTGSRSSSSENPSGNNSFQF